MENSNTTTLAIVLIVGLVIGGGIGYFAAPSGTGETVTETVTVEVNPLEGKKIQVGYITSQASNLEYVVPNVQDIIMKDIKAYTDSKISKYSNLKYTQYRRRSKIQFL